MGAFKPLLPVGNQPAVVRCVNTAQAAGVRDIIVVTGYLHEELENVLRAETPSVRLVYNSRYQDGMFSSVNTGISALAEDLDGFFLLPADCPAVLPDTLITLIDEFTKLPAGIFISTDDGSFGFNGNVVEQMRAERIETDMIYACGPKPMLRAVADYAAEKNIACSVSLEERMACGLGACLGCAVKVKSNYKYGYAYKRACADGPVFDAREVFWDD